MTLYLSKPRHYYIKRERSGSWGVEHQALSEQFFVAPASGDASECRRLGYATAELRLYSKWLITR